jgi:hypothetical protein
VHHASVRDSAPSKWVVISTFKFDFDHYCFPLYQHATQQSDDVAAALRV